MWSICEFLLVTLLSLVFVNYLKMQWSARHMPPGPSPLPLLGNLWMLKFSLHPDILNQIAKRYGTTFTIWMGHTPIVVLHGLQAVKDALVSLSEELSGRPVAGYAKALARGRGIAVTNGHRWRQQRRFGLITLRNLGLGKRGLESRIQEESRCLVESFASNNGKPMDCNYAITHAVANVISAVVFGHRFSSDDVTFQKLVEGNDYLFVSLGSKWGRLYDAFPWLMNRVPGPHQKAFRKKEYLEDFVRNELKYHQENVNPEEPNDVIDYYLAQITKTKDEPDTTFDYDNLVQVVIDLFIAGTETTTTTLQWALLFMLVHPEVQEKVQKELDAVLETSPVYEDRKRLPYTNAVIHEIQRYANVSGVGVPRRNITDITLNGFQVKKGTTVLPDLDSVLHDPKYWETPNQFNPNHFLDKDGNFMSNEAFLPFAAGHRVCLGEQLARIELFIFLTTLLKTFSFCLPEGVTEVNTNYILAITLKPHPFKICAVPRSL